MSKQTEQKLQEAQRELELYSDNVLILQADLQKANKEYNDLLASLQMKISQLETPLIKAKANFDSASREFARAQKVFEQEQSAFRNAQEAYDQKKQNEIKHTDSAKLRLEEAIKSKEKEISITHIRMKNAERDVAEYLRQKEKEDRTPANDNKSPSRRNNLVA